MRGPLVLTTRMSVQTGSPEENRYQCPPPKNQWRVIRRNEGSDERDSDGSHQDGTKKITKFPVAVGPDSGVLNSKHVVMVGGCVDFRRYLASIEFSANL